MRKDLVYKKGTDKIVRKCCKRESTTRRMARKVQMIARQGGRDKQ